MDNKEESTKIESFWEWFMEHEAEIKEILDDEIHPQRDALVRAMDNHILGFGLFTWEMGPATRNTFFLTISPNADKELLPISRAIMDHAPDLPDWTFLYAKPAKEGHLHLKLYDEDFNEHHVDALEWKFVLVPCPDKKVDVLIEAPNMAQLDFETQADAGSLVVSNLLGEVNRIQFVRRIIVVQAFDPVQEDATPIGQLKQQFDSLNI